MLHLPLASSIAYEVSMAAEKVKFRASYTAAFKLKVVQFAEESGKLNASKVFGVHRKRVLSYRMLKARRLYCENIRKSARKRGGEYAIKRACTPFRQFTVQRIL